MRIRDLTTSLVLAVVLAGCAAHGDTVTGGSGSDRAASTRVAGERFERPALPEETAAPGSVDYVALGDSFTSIPLTVADDLSDGCQRTARNYPRRLAVHRPELDLVDVSCAGATTAHMTTTQPVSPAGNPPQLDAVRRGTDLVTIGLGANDLRLYGSLVLDCVSYASWDPYGSPCRDQAIAEHGTVRRKVALTVRTIRRNLETVVAQVRRRAPEAQVVLVDYPQLVPRRGTCAALPLAVGDYDYARRLNAALSIAVARAARNAGVDAVDLLRASRGHDVCSDDPWVNGQHEVAHASAWHPTPAGQRAATRLLLDIV